MSDVLKPLGFALPARIADLETQARAAISLTEQVRSVLPAEQGNHLLSASYRDNVLSVTMDSAAWCPQVRYGAAAILDALKASGGPDFVKLRVRVGKMAGKRVSG